MSYASDAKLKELDAKTRQLEAMVMALKVKLEAVEALTVPRPKRTSRDMNNDATGGFDGRGRLPDNH